MTTPSAARKKLAATIAVTITVAGPASDIDVSFELADTERLGILDGGPIEPSGPTLSREVVVSRIMRALKVQLRPQQKALWAGRPHRKRPCRIALCPGSEAVRSGPGCPRGLRSRRSGWKRPFAGFEAVDSDRFFAAAWASLGEAYLRLYRFTEAPEQLAEAEKALTKAVAIQDERPSVWIAVGMLHVAKGEHAEAEQAFQRVIESTRQEPTPTGNWVKPIGRPNSWRKPSPSSGGPSNSSRRVGEPQPPGGPASRPGAIRRGRTRIQGRARARSRERQALVESWRPLHVDRCAKRMPSTH